MDDRTRRTFTFFLFMVLGPLLTAVLCGTIVVRRIPVAVCYEEYLLRRQSGFETKMESVEFQRWNAKKYTYCSFSPPGAEHPTFIFPELNFRFYSEELPGTKSFWSMIFPFLSKSEKYYRISAPTLIVELDDEKKHWQVERFAQNFVEHFRKNLKSDSDVLFEVNEITIQTVDSQPSVNTKENKKAKEQFQLTFFEGTYTPRNEQLFFQCKFGLRDLPGSDPVDLIVERIRKTDAVQTPNGKNGNGHSNSNGQNSNGHSNGEKTGLRIQFHSGRTSVPVRFLALLFPSLEVLGPDAYFHGTVRGQSTSVNQWDLFFEDMEAGNIDFNSLGKQLTTYPMEGRATFGIQSSKLITKSGSTRFVGAKGWMFIEDGAIHRDLLKNLIGNQYTNLNYKRGVDPLSAFKPDQTVIPFHRCWFSFHLQNGKAIITPEVSQEESDLFLVLDSANIYKYYLSANMIGHEIPYAFLLVPFTLPKSVNIPVTPQIQNLLKHVRL